MSSGSDSWENNRVINNRIFTIIFGLVATSSHAYEISMVKVAGSDSAQIEFQSDAVIEPTPQLSISEESVEFELPGAVLHSSFRDRLELNAPHALIKKLSAVPRANGIRIRVTINGSLDGLRNRMRFSRYDQGLKLSIEYPRQQSATLNLLKEEQQVIPKQTHERKTLAVSTLSYKYFLIISLLLVIAAGSTTFLYVVLKKKGEKKGNRKYLIEQLAYCALGQRSGVSLLKIGKEFVLVGVTPQNVTLLSSLPALQAQYEDESRFERETFHDAVDEEIARLKKQTGL